MVRLPRGWRQAYHPQAARGGSTLNWRPGMAGTGQQRITPVPVGAYTGQITGVPLTGGQVQGIIPGYPAAGGSVTSPAAFATIAFIQVPPGTYTVSWTVTLAGTVSAADANNFRLFNGAAQVAGSVNAGAAGSYPQTPRTITVTSGNPFITVIAGATAPTAGAVYGASIPASSPPLTLSVGPQGLGTVWYPVQVTISTTTGALDTSTALVYLGAQGVPATLVGTVFSGNGTVALAIPSMTPGQVIIVEWAGGNPGDTAAANIIGTMDALTTVLYTN